MPSLTEAWKESHAHAIINDLVWGRHRPHWTPETVRQMRLVVATAVARHGQYDALPETVDGRLIRELASTFEPTPCER